MRVVLALSLFALTVASPAVADAQKRVKRTIATIGAVQDLPAFTPEQLEQRRVEFGDAWKLCVTESLVRWAPLGEGPGTLIDGAYGRCGDIERRYRELLTRITQDGRALIDPSMARQMTNALRESWRPRLVAAALDQKLARVPGTVASAPPR